MSTRTIFSSDSGVVFAKRGISLSKSYVILGVALSLVGIMISNLFHALNSLNLINLTPSTSGPAIESVFPLVGVPIMVLSALAFTTPVLLLYVYDKNNGVLEYFLSLGMDQSDVYRGYLKAALLLASALVVFEVAVNLGISLALGGITFITLEVSALTPVMAIPDVAFAMIIMMAFSSLQKQRVGSNQPLGIAIGVLIVLPTYVLPLALPTYAIFIDLLVAGVIVVLSVVSFLLASRLISREKLLP